MSRSYCTNCGRVGCEDDDCKLQEAPLPCPKCTSIMHKQYDGNDLIYECFNCGYCEDIQPSTAKENG